MKGNVIALQLHLVTYEKILGIVTGTQYSYSVNSRYYYYRCHCRCYFCCYLRPKLYTMTFRSEV